MHDDKPKAKIVQQRTSRGRTRAGCLTCKRRRVKCDEAHPQCSRCLRAALVCEGYTDASTAGSTKSLVTTSTRKPLLLPKPPYPQAQVVSLSSTRLTAILPDETEVDNRYLGYFREQATGGFQSVFDWTLWNRLVLQGCHHESFVRNAVVAIGALHKSLRITSPAGQSANPDAVESLAKLHSEYAYRTFGKALKKMQLAIDAGAGPRLALIACLLVVCFESHTGNRYKALVHAEHGLKIMQQCGSRSAQVEDEIADAFKNLDIQLATVGDRRTPESHWRELDASAFLVDEMPLSFATLQDAKHYWHIVMRRSTHFIATTWPRTQSHSLVREFRTKVPGGVTTMLGDTIHTTPFKVDECVRAEHDGFRLEIAHWLTAFEPLLQRIRRSGGDKHTLREYVVATMLQVEALTAKITLEGVVFTQEILYDQFHCDFKEIIRLAKDIVKVRHSQADADHFWAGSFLLDLGLNVPMFNLILRCRDTVLRQQAMEILKNWHCECWWDPLLIAAIGQFVIDVEEKGMVDGFIPESSRVILTAKCHCPPERFLLVQGVQKTETGLRWTEGFVRW